MSEPYVNTEWVAEHLGLSKCTVLRRVRTGHIPAFRLWEPNGPLRYLPSAVDAAVQSAVAGREIVSTALHRVR